MEVGEEGDYILSIHCHHQNDSCIKIGSDESRFNVSVGSDGRSHKTVSTNHNLFKEKGEAEACKALVVFCQLCYRSDSVDLGGWSHCLQV